MGPEVEGADGGRYIGRPGVGRGSGEGTGVNPPISSAFMGGEGEGGSDMMETNESEIGDDL